MDGFSKPLANRQDVALMKIVPTVHLSEKDNVLTLLAPGCAGDSVCMPDGAVCVYLLDDIPLHHKTALTRLPKDAPVVKYGVVIGMTTKEIQPGRWVHLHNMRSLVDEKSSELDLLSGTDPSRPYE